VGVILSEFQGRDIFGQVIQFQFKEIDIELAVYLVKLIVGPSIRGIGIYFTKVILIVRAIIIQALPDGKELTIFNRNKGVTAERTPEFKVLMKMSCFRIKKNTADFAAKPTVLTIVFIKILNWRTTAWAACIRRDVADRAAFDRL
jgi:hypothetical protein